MKYSRGVYRGSSQRRKRGRMSGGNKQNKTLLTKVLGLALGIFLLFLLIKPLFSGSFFEGVAATVNAKSGSTEFSIESSDQWTFLQDSVDLFTADGVKTLGNGNASLTIFGGNTIFLKENTEIKITQLAQSKDNEKQAVIELISGEIWANIPEDAQWKNDTSFIKIKTAKQLFNLSAGIFDISTDEAADETLVIKGGLDTAITQATGKVNFSLEAGQKLTLDMLLKDSISAEDAITNVEEIPAEFIESEWHLNNLATFFPNEASSIRQKLEAKKQANQINTTPETTEEENPNIAAPTISSPQNNTEVAATSDSIIIEGIAPENTYQISVNGYTLTRYQPGDRKWSYFASTKFGTMVPGNNTYSVIAITRDGQKSAPAKVSLNYKGVAKTAAKVITAPAQPSFAKATIYSPEGLGTETPWETSSSIVTIKGKVPFETNKVSVNEFALRQFRIGSGEFSYIANAQYGNFVKGNNLYVIKAYGPDGKSSEVAVNIIYTPVKL